jgi:hypothetical protein
MYLFTACYDTAVVVLEPSYAHPFDNFKEEAIHVINFIAFLHKDSNFTGNMDDNSDGINTIHCHCALQRTK